MAEADDFEFRKSMLFFKLIYLSQNILSKEVLKKVLESKPQTEKDLSLTFMDAVDKVYAYGMPDDESFSDSISCTESDTESNEPEKLKVDQFKPGLYVGCGVAFLVEFDGGEMCFKCIMKYPPEAPHERKYAREIYSWKDPAKVQFKRSIPEMNNFLNTFSNRFKLFDRKTMRIYDFGKKYFFVDFNESVVYWCDGTRYVLKDDMCCLVHNFNLNPSRLVENLEEDKRFEIDIFNRNTTCLVVNPDFSIRAMRGFIHDGERTVFGKDCSIIEPVDVDSFIQFKIYFESRCGLDNSLVSVKNKYFDRHIFWYFTWAEYDDLVNLFRLPSDRRIKGVIKYMEELEPFSKEKI